MTAPGVDKIFTDMQDRLTKAKETVERKLRENPEFASELEQAMGVLNGQDWSHATQDNLWEASTKIMDAVRASGEKGAALADFLTAMRKPEQ